MSPCTRRPARAGEAASPAGLAAVVAAICALAPGALAEEAPDGAFEAVPFASEGGEAGGQGAEPPARPELGRATGPRTGVLDLDPFSAVDLGDPSVPAEARAADFERRGREAFGRHDHVEAARLLQAAYRLGEHHALLYLLAQALDRAGEPAAAADRLERYLELGALDARQRVAVGRELEALRRQFSRVTLGTDPLGALLILGGQPLGTSPLGRELTLVHGQYLVEARLEGYRDVAERLAVPGGRPVDLLLRLEPLAGPGSSRSSMALEVSLWTTTALAGAAAVAAIVTGILASSAHAGLGEDRTSAELGAYRAALHATYGLSAAAGGLGLTASTLAIVRALRGSRGADR